MPQVKAFLSKRWTTKREVPAKIAIMSDMGNDFRPVYYQQRLAPGEINYQEKHLKRLYESDSINSQFLQSIFTEDYEKEMLDEVSQKVVMNGSVVPLIEKPKHDTIVEQVKKWVKVFYVGEPLSDFEREVERQYLFAKNQKAEKFKKRKSTRYKVRWTMSDLNRYQEQ